MPDRKITTAGAVAYLEKEMSRIHARPLECDEAWRVFVMLGFEKRPPCPDLRARHAVRHVLVGRELHKAMRRRQQA